VIDATVELMPGLGAATEFSPDDVTEYTPGDVNDTTESPDYNAGTCLRSYLAVIAIFKTYIPPLDCVEHKFKSAIELNNNINENIKDNLRSFFQPSL